MNRLDHLARAEAEARRPPCQVGAEGIPGEREAGSYRVGFVAGAEWQREQLFDAFLRQFFPENWVEVREQVRQASQGRRADG